MITAHQLHKQFKTKTGVVNAVDGVSFEARDGEITGLLGPNGAGKTTTLRMLYTLMQPDQGQVVVDGVDAARDPEAVRRALGVLGVPESRIEAVSFGKEKPAAQGSDESAWAQNRRAEISYR